MKTILFIPAVVLFLCASDLKSQKAYPFRDQARWFLVDSSFKKIGKKSYAFVIPLWEGRFLVKDNKGLYGVATGHNTLLIPIHYEKIDFYDGVYVCVLNKHYAYFDVNGKPVNKTIFGGYCEVHTAFSNVNTYKANGKTGLVYYDHLKNKYDTLPAVYDQVIEYVTNTALAKLNGKWGIVTEKGEVLHPFEFDSVEIYQRCFELGSCINIYHSGNYKGYVDDRGRIITPAKYLDAQFFSNNYALVMDDSKRWGYIDKTGREYFK